MSEHTPGPWIVALNSNDIPCIVQGPTQRVASAYFDGRDGSAWSKQVAAANARLIAAAPDPYEALKDISDAYLATLCPEDEGGIALYESARAALAKVSPQADGAKDSEAKSNDAA